MRNTVIHGDSLDVLRTMPDNSVDSFVTDPPYELGFMGKTWDSSGIAYKVEMWRECLRVLKPGGHLLAFGGTRTYHRMACAIEDAGFEIRDMIEWLYLSGFPKSKDVGKQFDKANGSKAQFVEESAKFGAYLKECRTAKGLSMKAIDDVLGLNTSYSWWEGRKSGVQPPSKANYLRLKPILDLDDRFDEFIDRVEAEREKTGERSGAKNNAENSQAVSFTKGNVGYETDFAITAPTTDLAKQWDGWGTALKPAHEPIVMARKPLDEIKYRQQRKEDLKRLEAFTRKMTVAECVEKYGTGAVNVDGCRIAATTEDIENQRKKTGGVMGAEIENEIYGEGYKRTPAGNELGRFPANCITLDADEWYSKYFNVSPQEVSKKASKKDRNSDWQGNEIDVEPQPVAGKNQHTLDGGTMLTGAGNPRATHVKNNHPTVKPTELMAWLIRLVTPPHCVICDPFAGSGSTLVAAKREGFAYIGIEKDEQYIEIIKNRLAEVTRHE